MQQSQLTMAQELVRKIQAERDQLQTEREELVKTLEAKESAIAAQEGVIAEKNKVIAGKNKDLKACDKLMREFKEEVKTLRAGLASKEMEWQGERQVLTQKVSAGEEKLRDIYKSEDFKIKVGESILPHWQQGVRIGVRQAVKAYGGLDARIIYFEPDYEDACGEPDIEDSDEEVESRDRDDPMEVNEDAGDENVDAVE